MKQAGTTSNYDGSSEIILSPWLVRNDIKLPQNVRDDAKLGLHESETSYSNWSPLGNDNKLRLFVRNGSNQYERV